MTKGLGKILKSVPSSTKPLTVRQFFGRKGVLSEWHPNYEYRPGQLAMAEAVESALADRKHLIVEAGTGTGKTLAYLVPAILSGKRIVVSTGTKNLQEQLFFKDIPFLQQHFARPLRVCYMKGRNNYACRQKIYDAENEADSERPRRGRRLPDDPATGRRPPSSAIAPRSRSCRNRAPRGPRSMRAANFAPAQKCPQFERCFITLMHQRAHAERHHHRQSPPVLRRSGAERGAGGRRYRGRHFARISRGGFRRSARNRGCRRASISAFPSAITNSRIWARRDLAVAQRKILDRRNWTASSLLLLANAPRTSSHSSDATEGRTGSRAHRSSSNATKDTAYLHSALELCATHWKWSRCNSSCARPRRRKRCRWWSRAREMARRFEFWTESGDNPTSIGSKRRGRGIVPASHAHRRFPLLDRTSCSMTSTRRS